MSAPTSSFRHGLRVRIGGIDGPRGVLLQCGGGAYWRVKLDRSGDWTYPDRLVVDGVGDVLGASCAQCELPYKTTPGNPICDACDEHAHGARDRVDDPPRPRRWNARLQRRYPAND
jgi:hypothetical protein